MINYCIVGLGSRGLSMYGVPIVNDYASTARLTGICDTNPGRLQYAQAKLGDVPGFTDFDEMLDTVPCDVVIVATKDALHHAFIVKAMQRGKDVITEKPMTVDAAKCRVILAAQEATQKRLKVTFNARCVPFRTKIKQLLQDGLIGDLHSVEFKWFLDTVHGADYFRRWHRKKENSGGLLVHKATHHFDLINWWIGLDPVEVAAMGTRHYYVPSRKPGHGERCSTCGITQDCEFYLDVQSGPLKYLYTDHEIHDGYYRDQCVFSEDTDIEDTMSLIVRYQRGVQMTYSLTAATSFEGWQVAFNGSKGRLEAFEPEAFITETEQYQYARRSSQDVRRKVDWQIVQLTPAEEMTHYRARFYPLFGGVETFEVAVEHDSHGGGDKRLRDHLFIPGLPDPLGYVADSQAGAMSILIGMAANRSIAERRFVGIEELLVGS